MDLGGGLPFSQQLRDWPVAVHGGRRQQRSRQLVREQHLIGFRQKGHPYKGV